MNFQHWITFTTALEWSMMVLYISRTYFNSSTLFNRYLTWLCDRALRGQPFYRRIPCSSPSKISFCFETLGSSLFTLFAYLYILFPYLSWWEGALHSSLLRAKKCARREETRYWGSRRKDLSVRFSSIDKPPWLCLCRFSSGFTLRLE